MITTTKDLEILTKILPIRMEPGRGLERGTVVGPIRRNRVIAQPQEHLEGSSFDQTLLAI